MASKADLVDIIGHLYDATTDMEKWPIFMEQLAYLFDASLTNLVHFDPSEDRFSQFLIYGPKVTQNQIAAFHKEFPDDPRIVAIGRFPGKPLSCRLAIGEETWHQSNVYKEMVKHGVDLEYSLFVGLPEENGCMTALGIIRGKDSGQAFTQDDCDTLSELIPHLKRAIDLQKRLTIADFSHRTALEMVDHIPTGIIVTNEDGNIKHVNATALEISDRKDGLSLTRNSITLARQEENADLHLAISKAVRSAREGNIISGHPLTVTRSEVGEGYPLMVSTLWGNHIKLGLGVLDDPMAVIFITDPDRPQDAPAELLQRLYGLTPSEARLLESLVAGNTVEETANLAGVTKNTARKQLKTIFQKTDTNRQASLIKKVVTSPIWLHNQDSSKLLSRQPTN